MFYTKYFVRKLVAIFCKKIFTTKFVSISYEKILKTKLTGNMSFFSSDGYLWVHILWYLYSPR